MIVFYRVSFQAALAGIVSAADGGLWCPDKKEHEPVTAINTSILDQQAISGCYLFPQPRRVNDPLMVQVAGADLACYRRMIDPARFTLVHFHGNGEAVADYIPWMANELAALGLNSLFVEYREYGDSTGKAQLVAMLSDGEAVIAAAEIRPENVIAFGRSIGSLYAIELVHRLPAIAGLILESGIADPSERFLKYADLSSTSMTESEVIDEAKRLFNHQRKLSGYHNPLLVMHAEHDRLVEISHAERNFQWSASLQKQFLRLPVGDHNTIMEWNRSDYFQGIRDFVKVVESGNPL